MIVRVVGLPPAIRGTTVPDEDGDYNVYLNKNLSYEMQRLALKHELAHINNGDFGSDEYVSHLESRAEFYNKKSDY